MPQKLKDKAGPTESKVMRTPRSLTIEITARCNLRCRYFYFFNNPVVEYRDLPADEWLKFFDELGSLGVMEVILAGGEPFIREDLRLLIDGIVRNRMRFAFLSNGGLISDETATFLAGTGRCDYVQESAWLYVPRFIGAMYMIWKTSLTFFWMSSACLISAQTRQGIWVHAAGTR